VAIIGTAQRTEAIPRATVKLTDIRVSTLGPWAAATVSVHSPTVSQVSDDTFYRGPHGWIDTASADFNGPETPSAVEDELGLNGSGRSVWLEIAVLVGWFLALCGSVDVLLQPRSAFQKTGGTKLRWLLIEFAGAIPLVGVLAWAVYAVAIRPGLVGAGGRPPRKLLKSLLKALASGAGSGGGPRRQPVRSTPTSAAHSHAPYERPGPKEVTCPKCNGNRVFGCSICSNRGYTVESSPTSGEI
jgi:hypothetical protein